MFGREYGSVGVAVRKVEGVGASGVAERHYRIGIEPRRTARSLASVTHPSRFGSNAREARSRLVPRKPTIERAVPASNHSLGTKDVNNSRTITPPEQYQLWRSLGMIWQVFSIPRLRVGLRFRLFRISASECVPIAHILLSGRMVFYLFRQTQIQEDRSTHQRPAML